MRTIPPHIAIAWEHKPVYEPGKRGVPSARPSTTISPDRGTTMTSQARAQRLVDEFWEHSDDGDDHSDLYRQVRHGIAAVLRHLADTEAGYGDEESFYAVPARTLEELADTLEAPSLLDRAMAGDASAARQFLHEAGYTDASGNWLPKFQPQEDSTND
jgi:hypothetical protein